MYTLKLDWNHQRVSAVRDALTLAGRADVAGDFGPPGEPGDEWTFKLEWNATKINNVRTILGNELVRLENDMLRARDNKPGPSYEELVAAQAQVWAARRDIENYLVGSESLSDVSRQALAWKPL